MHLLLDTHVALWAVTDDPRLSVAARDRLAAPQARAWVSSASLWEIAIKYALGRGDMPVTSDRAAALFRDSGFDELPISWAHTCHVQRLAPIHRDPFDRLLVAQALEEPMVLLTHDKTVASYSPTIVRV